MGFGDATTRYMKRMVPSLGIMALITYGMATGNTWLQYGSIIMVIAIQFTYQIAKSAKAMPMVKANMEEATRERKRGKVLFETTAEEVKKVKQLVKDTGQAIMSISALILMFAPLAIFVGTGYILGRLIPGIESWKTYLTGFLLSMPFSMIISWKMGLGTQDASPATVPSSYLVTEKGIVFNQMGRPGLIRFPIKKIKIEEDKYLAEVEGQPTSSPMIPNKVKLFTRDINQLKKILLRFTETPRKET